MSGKKPNPGHGYIVHERLGHGRWKEVFRAVRRGEWHDRALARFIDKEEVKPKDIVHELRVYVLQKIQQEPVLQNVAEVFDAFEGDDGEIYVVEELLYRPLEALAPLEASDQFVGIAHDLATGLAFLHRLGIVHRDLKLDNCGVDFAGTAKIFDLGSGTSEGGTVKGTTLTRAPELFEESAVTKSSDVWALGATLFALRLNEYPFVSAEEVRNRPLGGSNRDRFDQEVKRKALAKGSETRLQTKIRESFPEGVREILIDMLRFDPASRPSAEQSLAAWRKQMQSWAPAPKATRSRSDAESKAAELAAFLEAVLLQTVGMSSMQWARTSSLIIQLKESKDVPPDLLKELKSLQEKVGRMRTVPMST